jgi:hypothetical protein
MRLSKEPTMSESEMTFDPDFFRTEEQRRLYRTDEQIRADIANSPLHQMPAVINRHEPNVDLLRRGHLMPEENGHQFDERNQPVGISGDTNPFVDRE